MKDERLPVTSTRMNLKILEAKLKSVERGYSLLKCKSDALQIYFRQYESGLAEKRARMEVLFNEAFTKLCEAKFLGASIDGFKDFCSKDPIQLAISIDLKFGMRIPAFTVVKSGSVVEEQQWKAGFKLRESKSKFDEFLSTLIEFCSENCAHKALKHNLEITNKRKNSLEHKMIPTIQSTTNYITDQLDEAEREEFFRLKKIQATKKRS